MSEQSTNGRRSPIKPKASLCVPWWEDDPERLVEESDAMGQRFAQFRLFRDREGGLTWSGWLTSNLNSDYGINLVYPINFPYGPPAAYITSPSNLKAPHIFSDRKLCLMHDTGATWRTSSTAATVTALVAAWIASFEFHRDHCRRGLYSDPCLNPECPDWPSIKL